MHLSLQCQNFASDVAQKFHSKLIYFHAVLDSRIAFAASLFAQDGIDAVDETGCRRLSGKCGSEIGKLPGISGISANSGHLMSVMSNILIQCVPHHLVAEDGTPHAFYTSQWFEGANGKLITVTTICVKHATFFCDFLHFFVMLAHFVRFLV